MRWSIEELFYGIKVASGHGMSFIWRLKNIFRSIWRIIEVIVKWIFTGYCWATIWNLDNYLITVILMRLRMFKKLKKQSYSAEFNSEEELEKIIDQLIKGFEIMKSESIVLGAYKMLGDKPLMAFDKSGHFVSNLSDEDHAMIHEAEQKQLESDEETFKLFIKYFHALCD